MAIGAAVERTDSRAGVAPAVVQRLSRRTFSPTIEIEPRQEANGNEVEFTGPSQT